MSRYNHLFEQTGCGGSFREYRIAEEGLNARIDFFDHIIRVAFVRDEVPLMPTYTVCPDGICPREGRDKLSAEGFRKENAEVYEDGNKVRFSVPFADVEVELLNFRMTVSGKCGMLFRDRDYISYNFGHELGDGSMHFISREPGEKIFGLGDKSGNVNKAGETYKIATSDAMGFDASRSDPLYKHLPFYICENSNGAYGIYYDTYSNGEISFGKELNNYYEPFKAFRCDEENLVYYIIFGSVEEIVTRFSRMCGPILFPPKWTLKYCGSTMMYTDAPDADRQLRGFVEKCEETGIKPGGFYLSSGYTQIGEKRYVFHWNNEKIPSPEELAAYFKKHGVEFLPNVKPAFLTDHPLYEEIAKNGWFLKYDDGTPAVFPFWSGFGSYIDLTDPGAYDFWRDHIKTELVDKGYKNIWNDNNEYDICDKSVWACGFGTKRRACEIRPLFSFLMTMASLEAQDKNTRTYSVSRCGIGGLQRIAATWTGDNHTGFDDFRYNHKMAMTMSLSGFYNFGQDIGGFAGPVPSCELFIRWIQYGLFTPRFTLHSWKPGNEPTMPWLYSDLISVVRKLFDLREAFIPYLYNEMYRSVQTHRPIIYPVFLKYPEYDTENDAFFFGDSILACPVFDEGADSVTAVLPDTDTGWFFGEELCRPGRITKPAPLDGLPVWFVRAGSVIPFGEGDNFEFKVYALERGSFNYRYLNDDGISPLPDEPPMICIEVDCGAEKITIRASGATGGRIITVTDPLHREVELLFLGKE